MAAKKKLLALLGAVVVLLAALLALVKVLSPAEPEAEALSFLSMEGVNRITLQWPQETITLEENQNGTWVDQEDTGYPIRQSILENMVSVAQEIQAQRQLEGETQTGLDAPALTVTLENDTQSVTFSFGDSNSLTGDYYVQKEGTVYTLDQEVYTAFAYTKEALYAPQNPMELEENLASLEIQWNGQTLALKYEGDSWLFADSQAEPDQTQVASLISQLGYTETTHTMTDLAQVAQLRPEQPTVTVTALGSESAYFEITGPDENEEALLWDSSTGYLHRVPWEDVQLWLDTAAALLETE